MIAISHAQNSEMPDSRGKTRTVVSSSFGISIEEATAPKLISDGKPAHLVIHATNSDIENSGDRGGVRKEIVRTIVLKLDAEDLIRIYREAINAKIFIVPGSEEIAKSLEFLRLGLTKMASHCSESTCQ